MEESIEHIIRLGTLAPSGDNAQPWRFVVHDNTIDIWKVSAYDHPVYNFRERGTLFAHGALVENIRIAAGVLGKECTVRLFPDGRESDHVASVFLVPATPSPHPLFSAITGRATNRKAYAREPLSESDWQSIRQACVDVPEISVLWVTEEKKKQAIARAVSVTERIMLEDEELHREFFKSVRWTEKEERDNSRGLFIQTLELAPPQQGIFRLLRRWHVACLAKKIGMPRFIANENAKIYASSAAMGVLVVPDEDISFFHAGELFQRIWLVATGLGLSLQPITAIAYLAARVRAGDASMIGETHRARIAAADAAIRASFGIPPSGTPAMIFRIGRSAPPSARTTRCSPEILFEHGARRGQV